MTEKRYATRTAYGEALAALGDEYPFYVLDADLSKATQTIHFAKKFPQRFFNLGIAEGDMMSTAAGMASCGTPVFASTFAVFAAGRAFEQIRNSIAYPHLNVKIGATHGGVLIGEDGASHQAIEDIALMRTLPNMAVVVPCDRVSVHALTRAALELDGPAYLRFGRHETPEVYTDGAEFTLGKGNLLLDGGDVTIVACGEMVHESLIAAQRLKEQGISAQVIDMHTIKPLDTALLLSAARKTGRIVTVEDHSIIGGLGGAVAEVLAEHPGAKLRRVGVNDVFGASGRRDELAAAYGLNAPNIASACMQLLEK